MTTSNSSTQPLFVDGMPDSDYRNAFGLAQSSLKHFMVSPAHYLASLEEKKEPTKAMSFGSAYHAHVLAQDHSKHYAVKEKVDGRSKEGKLYNESFAIENAGKIIIDKEEHETLLKMEDALQSHDIASSLIGDATHREVAVFATYNSPASGIRLKGMIDGYDSTSGNIFDLKTAEDASPAGFRKAIWDRRYDIQQIHYNWLLNENGKPVGNFYFIAQEKVPPFAVGVYMISASSILKSIEYWKMSLERFGVCQQTGNYPAYSDEVIEINL